MVSFKRRHPGSTQSMGRSAKTLKERAWGVQEGRLKKWQRCRLCSDYNGWVVDPVSTGWGVPYEPGVRGNITDLASCPKSSLVFVNCRTLP